MNSLDVQALIQLGGTAGLIAGLVYSLKYMSAAFSAAQKAAADANQQTIQFLRQTIMENTAAFHQVREALLGCKVHGRRPHPPQDEDDSRNA